MKKLNLLFIALFAVALCTTSCREEADTMEDKMEEVSEDMEEAAEEVEDSMEEAADDMEEEMESEDAS